jgi:hypothetical protein
VIGLNRWFVLLASPRVLSSSQPLNLVFVEMHWPGLMLLSKLVFGREASLLQVKVTVRPWSLKWCLSGCSQIRRL